MRIHYYFTLTSRSSVFFSLSLSVCECVGHLLCFVKCTTLIGCDLCSKQAKLVDAVGHDCDKYFLGLFGGGVIRVDLIRPIEPLSS